MCILFAYGPAISCLVKIKIQTDFTFLVLVCPDCPGKRSREMGVIVVVVVLSNVESGQWQMIFT